MTDENVYVYVGVWSGLRVAVMVDRPEYKKDTASELARWIKAGYTVEREPLATFRIKGMASSKDVEALKKSTRAHD